MANVTVILGSVVTFFFAETGFRSEFDTHKKKLTSVHCPNGIAPEHRRKIKTEEKAKVVASVWGAEIVQFLAALAVLPRSIWKNWMNSPFLSYRPRQNF